MSHVRVRNSGAFSNSSCISIATGPVTSTTTSKFPSSIGEMRGCVDTVNEGFQSRRRRGELFNNGFYRWYETRLPSSGSVQMYNPSTGQRYSYNGNYLGYRWPVVTVDDTWKINIGKHAELASIACLNRVASADSMLAVSAIEMHKSVDMINNRVRSLVDLYRHVRGVARGRPRSRGNNLGSLWLEYRYGWNPMVLDCVGAYKGLTKEQFPRYTARGKSSESLPRSKSWLENSWGSGNGGMPWEMTDDVTEEVTARAYCLYTVDNSFFRAHALGLADPVGVAWEIVPWSFVVDWFVNVGDWLSAITPKIGVNRLVEGVTVTQSFTGRRTLVHARNPGPFQITGLDGLSSTLIGFNKNRTPGLRTPTLPPFEVNINVKRAIDALALFKQVVKR